MEFTWQMLAVLGFVPLVGALVPVWIAGRSWRRDIERFQQRRF